MSHLPKKPTHQNDAAVVILGLSHEPADSASRW
jgi:hypothetical protein